MCGVCGVCVVWCGVVCVVCVYTTLSMKLYTDSHLCPSLLPKHLSGGGQEVSEGREGVMRGDG